MIIVSAQFPRNTFEVASGFCATAVIVIIAMAITAKKAVLMGRSFNAVASLLSIFPYRRSVLGGNASNRIDSSMSIFGQRSLYRS